MIKHVVAWTFAEDAEGRSKAENADIVAERLSALVPLMSGIVEFRLVRPQPGMEASFDLMLDSAFTDADALRAAATHPAHQEVGAYIAKVRTGRWAMDYDPDAV